MKSYILSSKCDSFFFSSTFHFCNLNGEKEQLLKTGPCLECDKNHKARSEQKQFLIVNAIITFSHSHTVKLQQVVDGLAFLLHEISHTLSVCEKKEKKTIAVFNCVLKRKF